MGEQKREREREGEGKVLLLFAKWPKRTIEMQEVYMYIYIASQKAWFMAFIAIIKKVKNTLQEEIILNEVRVGGSPPIKGTLFGANFFMVIFLTFRGWKHGRGLWWKSAPKHMDNWEGGGAKSIGAMLRYMGRLLQGASLFQCLFLIWSCSPCFCLLKADLLSCEHLTFCLGSKH